MPKRKRPSAKKKPPAKKITGSKKSKLDVDEDDGSKTTAQKAVEVLLADSTGPAGTKPATGSRKIDTHCPKFGTKNCVVFEDFDCMLNQTNIGHNNNKYYVIQTLKQGSQFWVWNRWGRVGESGSSQLHGPVDMKQAKSFFCKKFNDKTRNAWDSRDNFTPAKGKYTMIDIEIDDDDEPSATGVVTKVIGAVSKVVKSMTMVYQPTVLDGATQLLIKLIFDEDTFNFAMTSMQIDLKKMPLGKLSKTQIAKGFEVLDDIEKVLDSSSKRSKLEELSSKFYTIVPHDFGRNRPSIIEDKDTLRQKLDMLLVLGDIEMAQSMQKKVTETSDTVPPNPLDVKYDLLNCDLQTLSKKSKEFQVIEKYYKVTGGGKAKLIDAWKVDRKEEGVRFLDHDGIKNRRLLWHGTSVAVVAAILKTGLRIMPHSGGRVGKGIYFASEWSKSSGYAGSNRRGEKIMFLNEVALGKEHHITQDRQFTKPPQGFDSVIARGTNEPDPKFDSELQIEGRHVTVPQGKPIKQISQSSFYQSEYLIYRESQCRIRYLLKFQH